MAKFSYHTVSKTILGDLLTPVSAYLKVRDAYPQSALLESSDYHGGENAKSFIALHPIASVGIGHGKSRAEFPDGTVSEHVVDKNYTADMVINDFLKEFSISGDDKNYCGLFGYTSFNAVRYFENIDVKDEVQEKNDAPDLLYILYKDVVVFDHFKNSLTIIEMLTNGESEDLDQLEQDLKNRSYQAYDFKPVGECTSTLTDDEHRANIRRGIAHCKRGDVFQIVLSRRFIQHYEGDDFKLYRALRSINPSPYLFYFDFGNFRIFGSSPETHCRIDGKT
ncbi:MAG: chorismate-binding protein, partial [Paludibacteraceae bacterium]|nr:chorismate-binding protein [Paludibacteraceae bacterium]